MAEMLRARLFLAMVALSCGLPAWAQSTALSSDTDYSRAGARDLPVTCKPGDVQPFAGKTMAEVFGDAWPVTPTPVTSSTPVEVISSGRVVPPRGLEGQFGIAVIAVLVGADGAAIAYEAICATSAPYSIAAKRALRTAAYKPATADGAAVTSVIAVPVVFRAGRGSGSRDQRDGDGD